MFCLFNGNSILAVKLIIDIYIVTYNFNIFYVLFVS